MNLRAVFREKTNELMKEMDAGTLKTLYRIAAALYFLQCRKKNQTSVDKVVFSCYNKKKERMFLMDAKIGK